MSRLKKFTNSLFSTYLFLGVNGLYTILSVPLALKYLNKAEFGLWVLTLQVTSYIALIDLGMGSSVTRTLIDHKDQREDGRYGSVIKSGLLVGAVQGIVILIVGLSLVWFAASWLKVPSAYVHEFLWLMAGQIVLASGSMVSRVFNQVLYAWQRIDIYNYIQIIQLVGGFIILWIGFSLKLGVFSLLVAAVAGWISSTIFYFVACIRLGFWPRAGEWGRVSGKLFQELFRYGMDVFLIALGSQLILSSQTLLVSRQLGIEAVAVWSIMTKAFMLAGNMVWRIIANAMPALAEMHVRGEWERLWNRYRTLFLTVNVLAVICAVLFAACNTAFVNIWTNGRITWSATNDVLLAGWFLILTQQCCHNTFILYLKQVKGLQYVYLLEGFVFIGVTLFILRWAGITGMLTCSLSGAILFTWLGGIWRVSRLADRSMKLFLWDWQRPLLQLLVILIPCWLLAKWLLVNTSVWLQIIIISSLVIVVGAFVSIWFVLPRVFILELVGKLPAQLHWTTSFLPGSTSKKG